LENEKKGGENCLKSRYKIASVIFLVITLISVVTVSADDIFSQELKFKNDGIIWYFSTLDWMGNKLFSGHDVTDITATYEYTYEGGVQGGEFLVPIKSISLADKHVKLSFDKSELPKSWELVDGAISGKIRVHFKVVNNINTHTAVGPGFGWRRRP
jgi:hypothetical protein